MELAVALHSRTRMQSMELKSQTFSAMVFLDALRRADRVIQGPVPAAHSSCVRLDNIRYDVACLGWHCNIRDDAVSLVPCPLVPD
jgi:hypothetical protein